MEGVEVREIAGPAAGSAVNQSVVHAVFGVGAKSSEHRHRTSEEVIVVQAGRASVRIDGEHHELDAGECIVVAPGARHKLFNVGDGELVLLACCSPAFSLEDTEPTE